MPSRGDCFSSPSAKLQPDNVTTSEWEYTSKFRLAKDNAQSIGMISSNQRHTLSGTNEDDNISRPKHNWLRSLLYNQSTFPCPARLYKKTLKIHSFLTRPVHHATDALFLLVRHVLIVRKIGQESQLPCTFTFALVLGERERESTIGGLGCVGILTSVAVIRCLLSLSLATMTHAKSSTCCVCYVSNARQQFDRTWRKITSF